jgi:hypothetical protein
MATELLGGRPKLADFNIKRREQHCRVRDNSHVNVNGLYSNDVWPL